jgi:hypothetical protein
LAFVINFVCQWAQNPSSAPFCLIFEVWSAGGLKNFSILSIFIFQLHLREMAGMVGFQMTDFSIDGSGERSGGNS